MSGYVALVLDKLRRQRERPLGEIVGNAVRFVGDAAVASRALRACTRVGPGARSTGGRPLVRNEGRIVIGSGVKLTNRWVPVELETLPGGELTIGDDVFINYGTLISASRRVTIGSRVMFGSHSIVADSETPGTGAEPAPIEIGDDVWLAVRVTVLPGAKIGDGAVITAGSIVSGEIPPRMIAGGVPAVVRRPVAPNDGSSDGGAR